MKVDEKTFRTPIYYSKPIIPEVEFAADKREIHCSGGWGQKDCSYCTYCSGWHIFLNKKDAEKYASTITSDKPVVMVKKVTWAGQLAKGFQSIQCAIQSTNLDSNGTPIFTIKTDEAETVVAERMTVCND